MANLTFETNHYLTPAGIQVKTPRRVSDLSKGLVLLSEDNHDFIALGGSYAKAAVAYSMVGGTFSLSRLRVAALSLISGSYSTKRNDGTRNIMPVRIPRFSRAGDDARFVKVMGSFCLADGFIHNYRTDDKNVGMLSQVITQSRIPHAIELVPKIVNSWPQHKDAQPYIAKAVQWAKDHANAFMRPVQYRWYVWLYDTQLFTNSMKATVSDKKRPLFYPYADFEVNGRMLSLPVWWPLGSDSAHATGSWGDRRPFGNSVDSGAIFSVEQGEYLSSVEVPREGDHFSYVGDIPSMFGAFWTQDLKQSFSGKKFEGNPGPVIAKQGYDAFQIIDDEEITWELQADARNTQVARVQNDTTYKTRGCIQGVMPDCIVGGSQYALLYGMSSAVTSWKNGSPIECAALVAPLEGDFEKISFSSAYEYLFGPRSDLYD